MRQIPNYARMDWPTGTSCTTVPATGNPGVRTGGRPSGRCPPRPRKRRSSRRNGRCGRWGASPVRLSIDGRSPWPRAWVSLLRCWSRGSRTCGRCGSCGPCAFRFSSRGRSPSRQHGQDLAACQAAASRSCSRLVAVRWCCASTAIERPPHASAGGSPLIKRRPLVAPAGAYAGNRRRAARGQRQRRSRGCRFSGQPTRRRGTRRDRHGPRA